MMDIKQLFFGYLGRSAKSEKDHSYPPEVKHQGRIYRLVKKLPIAGDIKGALMSRFGRQGRVITRSGSIKKIETLLNNARRGSKNDSEFLSQVKDNLLCSLYHGRMNEFGKHLALDGKRLPQAYLRDIGAVMQAHVKGSEKNGIFTPAGGTSNVLTNLAFHILRDANQATQQAHAKRDKQTAHPIGKLSIEENAMLHHQAAHISDRILLSWFSDDTAKIYMEINNKLARIANQHMPQATPAKTTPLHARG